jgi:plasmid maintenance system antidote protein VapI
MQSEKQSDGAELLKRYCQEGFGSNTGKAALTLGREPEEIEQMLNGEIPVDDDLEIKIRGIAQERGLF